MTELPSNDCYVLCKTPPEYIKNIMIEANILILFNMMLSTTVAEDINILE